VRASEREKRLAAAAAKVVVMRIQRQAMIHGWPSIAKNQIEEHSEIP